MLADEEITDYIKASGGIIRQTRSNSDGSAALGPQAVTFYYLEADIAVQKLVEEAGFKFKKLAGIGGNDISRMAPLSESLMHNEATIQGGDGQHQNIGRLMRGLVRNIENQSEKTFADLIAIYGRDQVIGLVEFYRNLHLESEVGSEVELNGKTVQIGQITTRGIIPGKASEILNRSSSRPDARGGDVKSAEVQPNDSQHWHSSVYNRQMRRIGVTALQDLSGVSTFLTASFTLKALMNLIQN